MSPTQTPSRRRWPTPAVVATAGTTDLRDAGIGLAVAAGFPAVRS